MSRALAITATILLICGTAHAQSANGAFGMGASGMGTTSPLGLPGANAGSSGTGIPLAATEVNPGGLSPMPCGAGASSSTTSATGSNVPFDGGGMPTTTGCTSSGQVSSVGTASPLSGAGASVTLNGGTIPLGATEIGTGGLSPLIAAPMPTVSTSSTGTSLSSAATGTTTGSCVGTRSSMGTGLATGLATGMASSTGC